MAQVAEHLTISVERDFSHTPGSRNVEEGAFSGEDFLHSILRKKYEQAEKEGIALLIDLDGVEGYATSFLEEAFGGLARIFGPKRVLKILEFKSDDEPLLIDEITSYIKEATS
jgi:hypothetical protein